MGRQPGQRAHVRGLIGERVVDTDKTRRHWVRYIESYIEDAGERDTLIGFDPYGEFGNSMNMKGARLGTGKTRRIKGKQRAKRGYSDDYNE